MNDAYKPLGLSASHAYLLRLVLQQPGLLQKEIGEQLHLEKSTITRFIDKMVSENYLIRKPSIHEDIKFQHIYATHKAEQIGDELESIGQECYERIIKKINFEELTSFVSSVKNIANVL